MQLSELLDELRENILYDRSDKTDGDSDQLWSDTTLIRYINEAQRRFAVRSFVIRDSTTAEVCNVTLLEGVTQYALHESIMSVVSAKISGHEADIVRFGHSALGSYTNNSTMYWDPNAETWPPGRTQAFTTDEQSSEFDDASWGSVSMRVFPAPRAEDAGTIIKLRVVRKPIEQLTINNLSAVPEIPADHHIEMLDWAAYLALRINDVDGGNAKRAADYAQSFETHVQGARKLILRKLFAPRSWGFGRGGFSWES